MISRVLFDPTRGKRNLHAGKRMSDSRNFGLPLKSVRQMLPLTTSASAKDWAGRLYSERRRFDYFEELRMRVTFLVSKDLRSHGIAWRGERHKDHAARLG